MIGRRGFTGFTLVMTGGLLIWAAHFLFVYIFAALACARGFAGAELLGVGIVPFAVTAATVVACIAVGALMLAILRSAADAGDPAGGFLRYTALLIALLSLVAILWDGLPVLVVGPCA